MSTQDHDVPYESTGERLKAFAVSAETRERLSGLAARYWEITAYASLVLIAAVMRFWNLGARAMHHDESLHGFFSYGFTKGLQDVFTFGTANNDTYKHVPFMHGPFQFIGNGFVMWILGDGEFQARTLAATMGTALVFMPWLLRKHIGTVGALAAAAFLAFSPSLTYYSRFTREDIYTAFWTLGLIISMWRYLSSGENKWLFWTAGFMAAAFLTKETTFFAAAALIAFVDYLMAVYIADRIRERSPMDTPRYAALVIALLPVAWIIAIAWPFLSNWRAKYKLDELPAEGSLLIVMLTLAMPMYAAAVQFLPIFGNDWVVRSYDGSDFNLHPDEATVAYLTMSFLFAASVVIGFVWNPRVWLIAAAAFWLPSFVLYTTFLTNPEGFFSGVWGSLDYWMSQQDVRRGNQPDYYYFITVPVYEFLPLALAVVAGLYYMIRGKLSHALFAAAGFALILVLLLLPAGYGILPCTSEGCRGGDGADGVSLAHVLLPFSIVLIGVLAFPMSKLNRLLLFWLVSTFFALTVAGEKMPWLTVHIALPLAIVAGKFVGDMVEHGDLRAELPKLERLAPFAYAAVASALSILVFTIVGPFSLSSFGGWALAAVAAVSVYWAYTSFSRRTAMQVALVGFVAAFSVFTVRASLLASWGHPNSPYLGDIAARDYGDVPVEVLVYTQTSGDIPELMKDIEAYARESGQGKDTPVVVDAVDGYTWPWAWYLRNYRNVSYPTITDNFQPEPGSILLIGDANTSKLSLGGQWGEGIPYFHRRWFPESYRGADGAYSTRDFFRDALSVDGWKNWLEYWVRRTPPGQIGSANAVAFFPIGFEAAPPQPVGPTVRTEGTQLVIGGSGSAPGQLNSPSDVTLDAAGNLYVADTNNNRISKYDPQGNFIAAAGGFNSDFKLNQPWSLTVAADGTVFVADTWNHKIVKLDADLNKVGEWGTGGVAAENQGDPEGNVLFGPRDITLLANGNVLFTDTGNGRLMEYTPDGEFVRQYGSNGWKSGDETQFSEPVGVVVAANGDIYVADYWNRMIRVFDAQLQQKSQIDVPSWGSEAVTDRPYLALLADGRLLATDPANGKVLAFGADGAQLASYDPPKEGASPTVRPVGIATDGTSVWIADAAGGVVRKVSVAEVVP